MNYIYDVILNFQNMYYDFFEWNDTDEITHIRKIPIIKTTSNQIKIIINNKIKFEKTLLNKINDKTEKFTKNSCKKIKYCFIITDGNHAVALKLNKEGIIDKKSSLQLEENEDVINISSKEKQITLEYEIIKKEEKSQFETRFEINNKKELLQSLKEIKDDKEKLNYLYLECFNEDEKNKENMYNKIKKEILEPHNNFYKILNFFKLLKQK